MNPPGIPSRRAVLRGFAALGFGCGVVRLAESAHAKKRKKRKTCPRGKRIGSVNVPATGAAVRTPVLKRGPDYRLRASGYWRSNATRGQDAFADFSIVAPGSHVKEFEGVRLGLAVDAGSPDLWGSYDPGHVYERVVTGQGDALSLRRNDAIYDDNSGAVFVEIFCA